MSTEPRLREDILSLVEPQSQTDPDFKAPFRYTLITAVAVRKALIEEKGWAEELPSIRTIQNILNRLGYRLRKVQKSSHSRKYSRQMPFLTIRLKRIKKRIRIPNI